MNIIQLMIILFALFAISRSLLRIKDKDINRTEFIFWTCIWLIIIIIATTPSLTDIITQPLGLYRGIDVAVYVSIILLFYLIFRLYVKTEQTNKEITKLVRELAKENLNQSPIKNNNLFQEYDLSTKLNSSLKKIEKDRINKKR